MKITIIVDNPKSWIVPFVRSFVTELKSLKHKVVFLHTVKGMKRGDVAIYLSCERLVSKDTLNLHKHNLVVHESKLPKGRGMSPLTWQILEGKKKIPITLFEVAVGMDAGRIYFQEYIEYEGHELVDALREKQAQKTFELIRKFLTKYPRVKGREQVGKPTYYARRRPDDSALDINKSIKAQFNLLRVVDNEKYPATFSYRGHKYVVKIYNAKDES